MQHHKLRFLFFIYRIKILLKDEHIYDAVIYIYVTII